jgi:mitochondrial fission protein ELM1
VTTGEAGMRSQARGLAQAVAGVVIEKTVALRAPWSWFPAALAPDALAGLARGSDPLAPPWPDVMVTCGRRSAALSIAVRRASAGRTITAHIQDPRSSWASFDLIVAMDFDRVPDRPNVLRTPTAVHDLTPENLAEAAEAWRGRLDSLGRPLVGVAIGGPTSRHPFTPGKARRLIDGLGRLRREADVGLAITPSRRTPARVRGMLREAFAGDPRSLVWDLAGDNPYRAILALSDRLVVTSESVSMVSEAISTGHPVEVFDIGSRRHEVFLDGLIARGLARRFAGEPAAAQNAHPVNSTDEAAAALRRILQARTGVVG